MFQKIIDHPWETLMVVAIIVILSALCAGGLWYYDRLKGDAN